MIALVFKVAPKENSPTPLDVHHVPQDVDHVSMESIVLPALPAPTSKEQSAKVLATQDTLLIAMSANHATTLVQAASDPPELNVDPVTTDSS